MPLAENGTAESLPSSSDRRPKKELIIYRSFEIVITPTKLRWPGA
jgi:hypothetical protein